MEIVSAADSIFRVKGLLTPESCRAIIEAYQHDPRKRHGRTLGSRGESTAYDGVKVSTDLDITTDGMWAALYAQLHQAVSQAVLGIAAQFPSLQVWPLRCTGYKIQHYARNQGCFKWHFDALGPGAWERQLAMVLYLNSVASGGETRFHRQNLVVSPLAGEALFFPTFWTHMHCGEVPTSGDKYVISSFFSFVIPAAEPAAPAPL